MAQDVFPARAITMIVPFPPGGVADVTGRPTAAAMEKIVKQPVVVSNRPGAGGAVGNAAVANAKPDGYTILMALSSVSVIPAADALFDRKPAYALDQLAPIALVTADPTILAVHPSLPAKSVKELVALAKAKAGQLSFSSSGIYGALHMPMEMFLHAAKLKMRHVPTDGWRTGHHRRARWPRRDDCRRPGSDQPHVKSGKTGPTRELGAQAPRRSFPDVPTFKELGYDIEYYDLGRHLRPEGDAENVTKVLRDDGAQSSRRRGVPSDDVEGELADVLPRRARLHEILAGGRETARGSGEGRRKSGRQQVRSAPDSFASLQYGREC